MPPAPSFAPATTSSQALGNLQSFQGQMQSPQDMFKGAETSLGVPQAQQQVSGLRQAITNTTNLLNQVAPSVYGRTQNSLVTDAQAGRQIANEQAPLSTQLGTEGTNLTNASQDLSGLVSQAGTEANLGQQGQAQQLTNLQNIYQALYGQEQDTSKMAEAQREFNAQQSLAQAGLGSGLNLSSLTSGSTPGLPAGMTMKNPQRGSAGFNFNLGGKPVSAATFAAQNNIPIGKLLQQMGQAGDVTAQNAYDWMKNALSIMSPAQIRNTKAYKQTYSSLFWGA